MTKKQASSSKIGRPRHSGLLDLPESVHNILLNNGFFEKPFHNMGSTERPMPSLPDDTRNIRFRAAVKRYAVWKGYGTDITNIAAAFRVSPKQLRRWLTSETHPERVVQHVANFCNVTFNWIYYGENGPNKYILNMKEEDFIVDTPFVGKYGLNEITFDKKDFLSRFIPLMGDLDLLGFAELLGVPWGELERVCCEMSEPSITMAARAAAQFQIDLGWLLFGEKFLAASKSLPASGGRQNIKEKQDIGRRIPIEPEVAADLRVPAHNPQLPDIWQVHLPQYDVAASAGYGKASISENPSSYMVFDRRWLSSLGAQPKSCFVMTASGDSAFPTVEDGTLIIVDRSRVDTLDGGLYVLRVGDHLFMKRIQRLASGGLRLISDNSNYLPDEVAPENLSSVTIIGRVVLPMVAPRRP